MEEIRPKYGRSSLLTFEFVRQLTIAACVVVNADRRRIDQRFPSAAMTLAKNLFGLGILSQQEILLQRVPRMNEVTSRPPTVKRDVTERASSKSGLNHFSDSRLYHGLPNSR